MNIIYLSFVLLVPICSFATATTYTGVVVGNGGLSSTSGCVKGNGLTHREERTLPPFQSIDISGAFNLKLMCAQHSTVTLEMDADIIPLTQTTVQQGKLTIQNTQSVCVNTPLQITVHTLSIEHLTSDGANEIIINCAQGYDSLNLSLSGASTLKLTGRGNILTAKLEDASELDAGNNHVHTAEVNAQGSATVVINADKTIIANSSDASEIYYNDSVAHIQKTITDAGEVLPLSQK